MFTKIKWRIFLHILLLLLALMVVTYCFINGWYIYSAVPLVFVCYQLTAMYKSQLKVYSELDEFIASVRYRDFSRHFNVKQSFSELQFLRNGFNEVNAMFKTILKEKETQYQYLQKVLELVDTGILSYEITSGEVMWMNESLKRMLALPYLKTIHAFASRDEKLYNQIITLKPGDARIGTIKADNDNYKILLSATAIQIEGKKFNLIAFQNINDALNETEANAWQKLLNVLTHEIMNSIAPISSLADTIKNRLQHIDKTSDQAGNIDDLETGIDTIKRRSEGLLKFAETYRNLNKISKPVLKVFYVRDLFENLHNLMQPTLAKKNIDLEIILKDHNLTLQADISLIEQVLINLLINAIEAIKDKQQPRIVLSADITDNSKTIIKVADNGTGVPTELLDKIFIPFFTTKKNGSGIGLTLCKQIMLLHHGNITVQSKENGGTGFLLHF